MSKEKTIKDFLPLPFLKVGATKNAGQEVTERHLNDVLSTYDPRIHEAPIVKEPHEDKFAGFKHKVHEALAWVKKLGSRVIDGKLFGVIEELEPTSHFNELELVRLLKGPMKYNSPELFLGSILETELYDDQKTSVWPEDVRNKFYLRRVNLYGAEPIAQMGMPQSQYAESYELGESSNVILLADDRMEQIKAEYPAIRFSDESKSQTTDAGFDSMQELNAEQDKMLESVAKKYDLNLSRYDDLVRVHGIASRVDPAGYDRLFSHETFFSQLRKEYKKRGREY